MTKISDYLPEVIPVQMAQDALYAQSACNLSGLGHSLGKHLGELWVIAHKKGVGTDWVNGHPIVTMFLAHMTYLNDHEAETLPKHMDAWTLCKKVVDAAKPQEVAA